MNKRIWIFAAVLAVLFVGTFFATTAFARDAETNADSAVSDVSEEPEFTCGPDNCNNACGGTCGIPTCGCGR